MLRASSGDSDFKKNNDKVMFYSTLNKKPLPLMTLKTYGYDFFLKITEEVLLKWELIQTHFSCLSEYSK